MTALMWAAWSGDYLSATALLDARADPNLASNVRIIIIILLLSLFII